jgi:hypothetical protein
MAFQGAQHPATTGLPQAHRLVIRARGQLPPIGRPRHAQDRSLLAFQEVFYCSGSDIPDPHTSICRTCGDALSIR